MPTWETIEVPVTESKDSDTELSAVHPGATILAEPESTVLTKNSEVFMLVAGSFSVESNAMNLSADLTRKGFDSEVYLQDSGLHLVTFSAHADERIARTRLAELRGEKSTQRAWLKRVGAAH